MLRICAWCQREIGADGAAVGEPLREWLLPTTAEVTHGMCSECKDHEAEELRKLLPERTKIAD